MELKTDLEKMVKRWVHKIACHQASKDPEIIGRRLGFAEAATELKARLKTEVSKGPCPVCAGIEQGNLDDVCMFHGGTLPDHPFLHESAPAGMKCSDCTMDKEPCPLCYAAGWKKKHPNTHQIHARDDEQFDIMAKEIKSQVEENLRLRSALLAFAAAAGRPGRLTDSITNEPLPDDAVLALDVKISAWKTAVEILYED